MDFISRLSESFGASSNWRPETFLKFTNLDARVQTHLQKTYLTLAASTLILTLGVYAQFLLAMPMFLTQLASMGCMIALGLYAATPYNLNMRYALLAGFSFAQGAALAPLISLAISVQPSIVFTAALSTAAVFGCFSLAALTTQRRSYLYLGGYLSSAIMCLFVMRMGSYFFGGREMVFNAEVYLGLLVFCAYVLFDTQLIVEKAYAGNTDHVGSAMHLLVDLISIFVRLLIILTKNEDKKKKEAERKRRE